MVNGDAIQPQIVHQNETIIRGDGGAMGVRSGLAFRISAMTTVLKPGDCLAEAAVAQYAIRRGTAAVVIGDKSGFSSVIEGNFARSSAARGDGIDGFQRALFYGKGCDRTAVLPPVLIHLIDCVKIPVAGRKRQEAGVDGGACQSEGLQGATISIPAEGIDSFAGAAFVVGIGANKDESGWFAGP